MHLTVFSIKLKFVNSLRRTSPSHFISGLNPNMLLNLMQIFRSRQGSIRSIMFFTCTTVCCCGFDYSFSYFSFTMLWEALGLREYRVLLRICINITVSLHLLEFLTDCFSFFFWPKMAVLILPSSWRLKKVVLIATSMIQIFYDTQYSYLLVYSIYKI